MPLGLFAPFNRDVVRLVSLPLGQQQQGERGPQRQLPVRRRRLSPEAEVHLQLSATQATASRKRKRRTAAAAATAAAATSGTGLELVLHPAATTTATTTSWSGVQTTAGQWAFGEEHAEFPRWRAMSVLPPT